MTKTIIKTIFTYGALMLLACSYGYRVGVRKGFRDGHVRGFWLGKNFECYLRERIKEYGYYICISNTVTGVETKKRKQKSEVEQFDNEGWYAPAVHCFPNTKGEMMCSWREGYYIYTSNTVTGVWSKKPAEVKK